MNKKVRFVSCFLASAMLMSSFTTTDAGIVNLLDKNTVVTAAEAVSFINSEGYFEGAYAEWAAVSGASGYNVYCDGVQIDSMLVRQYPGYFRADVVGIKAGNHTIKVVPVVGSSEDTSKASSVTVSTIAHDRSGFAFANGKALGAYNGDGTLKSGAVVVYVTNENKDSVTAKIGSSEVKGLQNIISAFKKSGTAPLNIRCIGNITDPSTLDKGDLLVDGSTKGLTIEGIGNDTTFNGFGIRLKSSSDVEIRNLGLMNCDSSEGDAVGLQQDNKYCWVHNCDFFYGDAGSDADQAKGDGALDTKKSQYVTHSYNHFWDAGKTHLNGNGDTTLNYITYHHNWYDHSDSRHPLVRVSSAVHCYNNFYDGIAKYGMIARLGSSIFAESNYFKDSNDPILISQQGTDTADGEPIATDAGGMIKAYGNVFDNSEKPITHKDSATNFDCYEAASPSEEVPSSYKTVKGGTSYSNFDTSSSMYSYTADSAADVPAIVSARAGRVQGGDFDWDFSGASEDRNYDVNTALKSALKAYDDKIMAIGSGFKNDNTQPPASQVTTTIVTGATTPAPQQTTAAPQQTQAPSQTQAPQQGTTTGNVHDFTANGTSSSFYSITGNLSSSKGSVTYNGKTLTQCLKMESTTSISFTATSSGKLTLVLKEAGAAIKVDGTKYTADASGVATVDLSSGSHTITKGDSANLFYMAFSGSGSSGQPAVTTAPTGTAAPSQTQGTMNTTTAYVPPAGADDVIPGNVKVVSAGGWNEMMYLVLSGVSDNNITGVSYSGPTSGSLTGEDLKYLVRDVDGGVRVDVPGLKAGIYSLTLTTGNGKITKSNIAVGEQDRSGYAHYGATEGVGAYNNDGTLKSNAVVLYVTNDNKDTVSVTSKDGTTVTGIGNILNSTGQDTGSGATAKGGKPNSNSDIIQKLAEDGTPLVVRIVGNVTAPDGLTAYDSVDFGGSVGDNGFMARMQSGKDITIEGIGTDACINGWGIHFIAESSNTDFGESFEVRNIAFRNVPEDCIGMEGVQEGSTLNAPVERCWIHHCEFYAPKIANPAESDKDGGDGACDFKRGMYFTNSYCYYEGYHKTNLVGASDSNMQYHLTYHHNYWKNCESRGPLARQANIHMYNNVFEGQTSYCMNPRANAYIFSEYNVFENSKDVMEVKAGAVKSYMDVFTNCKGNNDGTIVSSKSEKVSSGCKYENFDTDSSVSYIPSGDYVLHEDTASLKSLLKEQSGVMKATSSSSSEGLDWQPVTPPATTTPAPTATTTVQQPSQGIVYGDLDNTNSVDLTDLTRLSLHLLGDAVLSGNALKAADVNGDNTVDIADLAHFKQYISKDNVVLGK